MKDKRMKTYHVTVVYRGEIEAECAEELEEKLWVTHKLFGEPYDDYLFEAEEVNIECEDDEDE
tara:strand:- start:2032 stop:2220 length:189 start_codon:yes stop_codon:yes gene_type:complete